MAAFIEVKSLEAPTEKEALYFSAGVGAAMAEALRLLKPLMK